MRWPHGSRPRGSRQTLPGARSLEAALQAGRAIDGKTPLSRLIALDVDFHRAIYRLSGNPAIEEMIAPQWPHMRRSMATVLAELDYRDSAWSEHETIARIFFPATRRPPRAPPWRMRSAPDE